MNHPRIGVEIKDDRLIEREQAVKIAIGQTVWMLRVWLQPEEVHHVYEPIFKSENSFRNNAVAARPSRVGTSPAVAITTSGSTPWSLLAQSQSPIPFVQWAIADSISRY